jgi:hypothetical protein
MYGSLRVAARAKAAESAAAQLIDQSLCEDASGGIARAQKENVVRLIGHRSTLPSLGKRFSHADGRGRAERTKLRTALHIMGNALAVGDPIAAVFKETLRCLGQQEHLLNPT